jgi:hypothetical protein
MNVNFSIRYGIESDLIISPKELRDIYMFGVNIRNENGVSLDDEAIKFHILTAQKEIENYLALKLKRQVITESKTFYGDDFRRWGYIPLTYQIECPISLIGFFNRTKQIEYPQQWLSVKRSSIETDITRNMYLVPSGNGTTHSQALTLSGIIPQLGYLGWKDIPNYWDISYVTGFKKVPQDIVNAVGKLASMQLFHIAGDLIIGAGIASQSISIDGLSQSINTTSSATNAGYGARVTAYSGELKRELPRMKDFYKGFTMGIL